jgi:hypothetical protein
LTVKQLFETYVYSETLSSIVLLPLVIPSHKPQARVHARRCATPSVMGKD